MRVVIILATVAASYYICNFNVNLLRGLYAQKSQATLWTAVSELLIELSIPACGYCGAMYNNRQLTCCFCCCNLFVTIVTIVTFIRMNIHISEIEGDCSQEADAEQRRRCEVWTSDTTEKWVMLAGFVVTVLMGCSAFWFGNSLYSRLSQDAANSAPMIPVSGEVISLGSTDGTPSHTGVSVESTSGAAATGGDGASAVTMSISSSSDPSPSERRVALPDRGTTSSVLSGAMQRADSSDRGLSPSASLGDVMRANEGAAITPRSQRSQLPPANEANAAPETGHTQPAHRDGQDRQQGLEVTI